MTTIKMPKKATKKTAAPVVAQTPAVKKQVIKKIAWKNKALGSAFFLLAIAVLSVSLPHLAEGMQATLGTGLYASVALAILFDLSQIAAEAYLLMLAKDKHEKIVAKGVVIAATAVSILYNGMAFLSHANGGFGLVIALLLAVLLPLLALALSYLGGQAMFKK